MQTLNVSYDLKTLRHKPTISMVLEDPFIAPSFFYLSTHISSRPQRFLPVQMTGGWISA